ncbi:MAG: UvrD-helicase domain-containing protein, partial [Candidatus Neomarinimicrobiota bacterium]|nr:UvrD-helicase domain-containing protein [Candidatus Neomarinimicrobiota bacterium]
MKLADLNTQQLKAVKTVKHPVLVFAGAGSGKTRVLTYKIWHLIKEKIYKPNEILALTFTNKAATEMKERIKESINCDGVNVGTFHSIGARVLRRHIGYLNEKYNNDFTIYDVSDQKALLKEVVEQL